MRHDRAPGRTQLVAGDVIAGRFVVERTIGIGGMRQVVSATHQELGTRVAIKVIRGDALGDHESLVRFKREPKALAKLTSVHTVRVYDVGETEDGLPYIIMEHLVSHRHRFAADSRPVRAGARGAMRSLADGAALGPAW